MNRASSRRFLIPLLATVFLLPAGACTTFTDPNQTAPESSQNLNPAGPMKGRLLAALDDMSKGLSAYTVGTKPLSFDGSINRYGACENTYPNSDNVVEGELGSWVGPAIRDDQWEQAARYVVARGSELLGPFQKRTAYQDQPGRHDEAFIFDGYTIRLRYKVQTVMDGTTPCGTKPWEPPGPITRP